MKMFSILAFVAILAQLATAQVCPLALNKWVNRRNVTGQMIDAATNTDGSFNATNVASGMFPSMSLARVTLGPCGVRVMHTHANVDELLYVLSGNVSASAAYANGSICEQNVLKAGDSFLYPRNLVHSARNLDCKNNAVVLGFFTAFDSATIQVAPAAYNMPGSPFHAYADNKYRDSIAAAITATTLAFDPACLERCKLGTVGGQMPVKKQML